MQLTRSGGFGVGGLYEVVFIYNVAQTKVPLRAFWKAARGISDPACDLVVDIQHEFDFYVDQANTLTFYGLVEVPITVDG